MAHNPPSVRYLPGDPKPVGFQQFPGTEHIDRTSEALQDLALVINAAEPAGSALSEQAVCLCSARFSPGTPFELYGYHINQFDEDGDFVDPREEGAEIRYAIVVNHTTEAQVEVALGFLFELIERGKIVEAAEQSGDLTRLDIEAEAGDARAAEEFLDRMRFGWREAAKRVAQLAAEEGLRLRVRYERDVFPRREQLVSRIPILRQAYNGLDSVRRAVDNTVSAAGGGHAHIRIPAGSSEARDFAQAQLAIYGLRQFQNQTLRDAEVCGNGFMVMSGSGEIEPRCIRPECALLSGEEVEEIVVGRQVRRPGALHLRGLEQIDSPYGMSVLEPYLFAVQEVRIYTESKRLERQLLDSPALRAKFGDRDPEEMIAFAERGLAGVEERLTRLLGFTRDTLPQAKPGLYFAGQERLE